MNNVSHPSGAIERYESYLKADPENTLLWISLGDLQHQAGRLEQAAACYEKCLKLDNNNAVARGRLANVMLTQHRFAEAEQAYRQLVEASENPEPSLSHNLGLALYYQKRWREALEAFRQAKADGLREPKNLAYIVYCLHHCAQTAEALEAARQWLEAAPGANTEGYIAMLEMDHGDMQSAYQHATKVLEQNPANPDAGVVVATRMIEQQQIDRAIDHFKQVVDAEPDNPRGWQGLGLGYLYQQDYAKAIQSLNKALQLVPGNETTLVILGWAELAGKDAVKAERAFRKALESDHNFGEAHGGLATALVFQNKLDPAREEIKLAMRLDPQGFGAVFANSVLLKLQGKGELGTRMLAKLFEQTPGQGSKPLIEYIQTFVRQQRAKGPVKPERSRSDF